MVLFIRNKQAFSLIELLTTVGIVGTLSVVGIKSYQKQTNQAKTAIAKKSLSYVYSSERSFHNNWGGYHENLAAVGVIPSGPYLYDVGFGKNATIVSGLPGSTYGSLVEYPRLNSQSILNIKECSNFKQICDGTASGCIPKIRSRVGTSIGGVSTNTYFSASASCSVSSACLLNNFPASGCTVSGTVSSTVNGAEATQNSFKAVATTKLKKVDVWSIDQTGNVKHENDGTQ